MKKYIGCRMFEVEPMTRGDYNAYRGWSVPADENPLDEAISYKAIRTDTYLGYLKTP